MVPPRRPAAIVPPAQTLLELGAGAGNNAFYFKQRFRCTLTDLSEDTSPATCAPSASTAPSTLFMVHDAVMYRTAFEHTRVGGAAVFAPDYVRETFPREDKHDHG